VAGFGEHDDEPSGSIKKTGFFFDKPSDISFSNNILHYGVSKQASSQEPAIGPYPDLVESSSHPHTISVRSILISPKFLYALGDQNAIATLHSTDNNL
jgi:hypothetical protein